MLGVGFIKFRQLFQKLLVMGAEGGGHSNPAFILQNYVSFINSSLHHNVLCLSANDTKIFIVLSESP